jgi:hypothetical protein
MGELVDGLNYHLPSNCHMFDDVLDSFSWSHWNFTRCSHFCRERNWWERYYLSKTTLLVKGRNEVWMHFIVSPKTSSRNKNFTEPVFLLK